MSSRTRWFTRAATPRSTNLSPWWSRRKACGAGSRPRAAPRSWRRSVPRRREGANSPLAWRRCANDLSRSTAAACRKRTCWSSSAASSRACAPRLALSCRRSPTTRSWLRSRSTRSSCRSSSGCSPKAAVSRSSTCGCASSPLRKRNIDDFPERWTAAQPLEPGLQARQRRALDRQAHPQVHVAAERNVPHAEIAGQVLASLERRVGNGEQLGAFPSCLLDRVHVPLLRRRAHQPPEHGAERSLEGERPVHPAVGVGAHAQVVRPERAGAVLGGEVAHD